MSSLIHVNLITATGPPPHLSGLCCLGKAHHPHLSGHCCPYHTPLHHSSALSQPSTTTANTWHLLPPIHTITPVLASPTLPNSTTFCLLFQPHPTNRLMPALIIDKCLMFLICFHYFTPLTVFTLHILLKHLNTERKLTMPVTPTLCH